MAQYIKAADVEARLRGKVRFADPGDDDPNKMSRTLLCRLIDEAEGQVEMDLSIRYMAPFQCDDERAFESLPAAPTRNYIRTLCELMAVMRVLETDFGSGTTMSGDAYFKTQSERYESMVKKLVSRDEKEDSSRCGMFVFPPLPGLRLNYHNTEADDGYAGAVLVSHGHSERGSYPADQINSPGETFWNYYGEGRRGYE